MAEPRKPLDPKAGDRPDDPRTPNVDPELTAKLRAALGPFDVLGLRAEVRRGVAYLRGVVGSHQDREAIERIAREVPGVTGLVSGITVEPSWPSETMPPSDLEPLLGAEDELSGITTVPGTEPDFNFAIGTNDPAAAADGNEPYYPPTDPVVKPIRRSQGDLEILGGFASGALDSPVEPEDLPTQLMRGDEEIAEEVARALEEDAGTTDLDIRVRVRRGVVTLRGHVASLDEAEMAEQVASNVPGVREVREELEVVGM